MLSVNNQNEKMFISHLNHLLTTDFSTTKCIMTGPKGALRTNSKETQIARRRSPSRAQGRLRTRKWCLCWGSKRLTSLWYTLHTPHSQTGQAFSPLPTFVLPSACLEGSLLSLQLNLADSYLSFMTQLESEAMAAASTQRKMKSVLPLSSHNTWVHSVGIVCVFVSLNLLAVSS